jgi:transcriptional regulator with GAF, ATPase, and Fis domain
VIKIGEEVFEYRDSAVSLSGTIPISAGWSVHGHELIEIIVKLLKKKDSNIYADLVASVSKLLRCDAARLVGEDLQDGTRQTIVRYPEGIGLDRFSSRAIDWAGESSQTILMQETSWSDNPTSMTSLEQNAVSSLLCAPLRNGPHLVGYLYLDRLKGSTPFSEDDRVLCDSLVPLFTEIVLNAEEHLRQRQTIERLQKQREDTKQVGIIYESPQMQSIVALSKKYALTDSPVLISGETGTGKELIARFIHQNSTRCAKPFRAINCGAIPETLMESEMFGHEKGAFTGATQQKQGLFESADSGIVFLDEIGEMPFSLQVKLLRVLQEAEIVRLGSTVTRKIDVRIIAATNRNLETEVAEGRFRQDLFYRLYVLTIELPLLHQRGQDVLLLAEYFIHRYCEQFGLAHKRLTADARNVLLRYSWPGNIRELENIIQKACLLSEDTRIDAQDIALPKSLSNTTPAGNAASPVITLKDYRSRAEHEIIEQTLRKTGGNISQAAKLLDIDRKWLMKKMEDLTISADSFRK